MSGLFALLAGGAAALALALTADAGSPAATLALALGRTGWLAAVLLVASLTVSLVARRARRPLGLAAAGAAALHAGWSVAQGWVTPAALITEPQLRSGATALAILLLLTLTSWPSVVASLRLGHWRPLHRASYAAAALVVHHVALSSRAPLWGLAALAGAIASLLAIRVVRGVRRTAR
ncbi:MAG: ferric reductase-like transmembrane domain-containing protein [Deltaproteobacteria bacterium]|nr:ferric reductase-like transmembrane domain-containing protein [Deltaproteobacteria bacterium]